MVKRLKQTASLQSLKNIGPQMESWLIAADIKTPDELDAMGAVGAYEKIRSLHKHAANKMALYALYGAIHDMNCLKLSPEIKDMLNDMLDQQDNSA